MPPARRSARLTDCRADASQLSGDGGLQPLEEPQNFTMLRRHSQMRRASAIWARFSNRSTARFENQSREWKGYGHQLYSGFGELMQARAQMDERIVGFADRLDPAWLEMPFEYRRTSGAAARVMGFVALTHFFNHQIHHRGQVSTLLMQAGINPGVTDLVAMPDLDPSSLS